MSYTPGTYISFNQEPQQKPKRKLWLVGTRLKFQTVDGAIKSAMTIPVMVM